MSKVIFVSRRKRRALWRNKLKVKLRDLDRAFDGDSAPMHYAPQVDCFTDS